MRDTAGKDHTRVGDVRAALEQNTARPLYDSASSSIFGAR